MGNLLLDSMAMNHIATALAPAPFDELSALAKASGDPLRLSVLRALADSSFGVLELASIFDIKQSGMSHHLKVLAQAGLVTTRREGNAIFYRRTLPAPSQLGGHLHKALLEEVDRIGLPAATLGRLASVESQRAHTRQNFYSRMEEKFRAQQDLIAGLAQYRESLLALIDKRAFSPAATALEVGPGDGEFLPDLAERFRSVSAVDNDASMLELARALCESQRLSNVKLHLADALGSEAITGDCVVLNMVLHHFSDPATALCRLAARVNPGGCLLITDLCSHNQDWAREACGDLWLGFEQHDLAQWATAAGLVPGDGLYVGLRNGFQIQARLFERPSGTPHHR
ncbi:transcriptional regulator, ArsR family [Pseudomonas sp. URIL14HWK12:I9]|nr:helix-turn-helix protein [Pseudomonas sp. URIL14HWK12:I12]PVZ24948.1 helix-turn-helix protein [Pseudomonas sp. URIL14HWK12:I10]PVZ34794.1 helix-turn-helix protein [Pseudomonas sp. URIL14HWK12:I11]SNZ09319.1 transcriptional regulator, ArsR family [Pseudomonas sp. URIL14HWK12:I9]